MPTMIRLLKPSLGSRRFWLGTLLSVAAGVVMFQLTASAIESDSETRFLSMARIAQNSIAARIKSYTDVLRGTAGLFSATPGATDEQFRHYFEQLDIDTNFPGIEVINYAQVVTEAERPALERYLKGRFQSIGVQRPGFSIKSRGAGSTYTVIVYIEPRAPLWYEKLGMDLEARAYTRKALAESRDQNSMTASGTRVAILSGPNHHGLAMRLPVYRSNMPHATPEQRRAAYLGSVGIGFGVNSLITGVLESLPTKGTRLVISDVTPVPAEPGEKPQPLILFDSSFGKPDAPSSFPVLNDSVLHARLPIEFNRRSWIADFSIPRRDLYSHFDAGYPWLAAVAGTLTIALLYALFQTLAASRRNAMQIAEDMTKELRASQAKLQASHEKLRRLAAHTEQIKERERKRIAREIHDDLGQNLLALRIDAEMLASRTRNRHSHLHARAEATLHQIDTTIRSVRQIINDLRPNVLDLGLNAAVDWLVADFQRRSGIKCYLIEHEGELKVDDACATACFRILQESLNNVARHARATEVHVELQSEKDLLVMTIGDNGIGLQPGSRNRPGSFGLVGIEERVNMLGGRFSIQSEPGAGTVLSIAVPITGGSPGRPRTSGRNKAVSEKISM
jgi:signal transduction histidine kinase